MKTVKTIAELPRSVEEKFHLPEGHEIDGCYARNGYPDGIFERIPGDSHYEVVALWANQMMVAVCDEEDSFCSSKHRYVIILD